MDKASDNNTSCIKVSGTGEIAAIKPYLLLEFLKSYNFLLIYI